MLYINENRVRLTRGDSAYLTVPITNDDTNDEYIMAEDDILELTVRKTVKTESSPILLQKRTKGHNTFYFLPEDTEPLAYGPYKYDVQLTTAAGDVYTIIEPHDFELMTEVT